MDKIDKYVDAAKEKWIEKIYLYMEPFGDYFSFPNRPWTPHDLYSLLPPAVPLMLLHVI